MYSLELCCIQAYHLPPACFVTARLPHAARAGSSVKQPLHGTHFCRGALCLQPGADSGPTGMPQLKVVDTIVRGRYVRLGGPVLHLKAIKLCFVYQI